MVTPDQPPHEEQFEPLRLRDVIEAARRKRRGPVGRFVLFVSGVKVELLRFVPTEETIYSVLGVSVLVTAAVASVGSGVAAGYLDKGVAFVGALPVAVGLCVGFLIFSVDRLLVKAPLNPYVFEPEILNALWNPSADVRWYDLINGRLSRGRPIRRLKEILWVFVKASPRFVIALCASFIYAEIALYLVFSGEVTTRALAIQEEQKQQQIQQINTAYLAQRGQLENQIKQYSGSDDPVVTALTNRLSDLKAQLPAVSGDAEKLGEAAAYELDGKKVSFTLSDGTTITTTGSANAGPNYITLNSEYSSKEKQLGNLNSAIGSVTGQLNKQKSDDAAAAAGPIKGLQAQEKALDIQHDSQVAAINSGVGTVKGVLIREQALNQLANDMQPTTAKVDPPPACPTGIGRVWCDTVRFFVEPTPLGGYIGAFRGLFLSIELLPILLKIVMSLRRRRPYDALVALIDETSVAQHIDLLDNILIQVGALLESRASWRKSQRSGAGAEFILTTAPGLRAESDEQANVLVTALGKRYKQRIRLWPRRRINRTVEQGTPPFSGNLGSKNGHR